MCRPFNEWENENPYPIENEVEFVDQITSNDDAEHFEMYASPSVEMFVNNFLG